MKQRCLNHPGRDALGFCHVCRNSYCHDCLIEGKDFYYCSKESCRSEMNVEHDGLDIPKSSSPEAPTPLVTVCTYTYPYEADLAKSRLEAEGIPVFVKEEFLVRMNWLYSNALGGIKLQVAEPDAEDARQILFAPEVEEANNTSSSNEDPEFACPKCGGDAHEFMDETSKRLTYLSWLLLSFPIFKLRRNKKCSKCEFVWRD